MRCDVHTMYCRLKDVLGTVEDMEIDIPKVWQYLAETISPMVVNDPALQLRFLQNVFEPLKQNPQIGEVIAYILQDSAKRLVRILVTNTFRRGGRRFYVFLYAKTLEILSTCGNFITAWWKPPSTRVYLNSSYFLYLHKIGLE